EMLGDVAAGEDRAVDLGMQRLHAAVQHLRKACGLRDVDDPHPRVADRLRGAPGREDLDAKRGPNPGGLDEARFGANAHERPADFHPRPLTSTLRPSTDSRPSANRRTASG